MREVSEHEWELQTVPEQLQVKLIVTADDLGISPERDEGIFEAFQHGIVTTASLLVNGCSSVQAGTSIFENAFFLCHPSHSRFLFVAVAAREAPAPAQSLNCLMPHATHALSMLPQRNEQPLWGCRWACT